MKDLFDLLHRAVAFGQGHLPLKTKHVISLKIFDLFFIKKIFERLARLNVFFLGIANG